MLRFFLSMSSIKSLIDSASRDYFTHDISLELTTSISAIRHISLSNLSGYFILTCEKTV